VTASQPCNVNRVNRCRWLLLISRLATGLVQTKDSGNELALSMAGKNRNRNLNGRASIN